MTRTPPRYEDRKVEPVEPDGKDGVLVRWQAMGLAIFLASHLGLAIWFASSVQADVAAMKEDVGTLVMDVKVLTTSSVSNGKDLQHLTEEVNRLRRYHESQE